MRIQHNILAMNAYRNYNNNASALSKNLEKLSSGYKINRAGDDAAGLAISEKMRAQITGLEAATKNVKDGISLVKTAEGAMQEIHDMLNRMDYLATQSANGTYDNEVDRANLQKEVDSLMSEINRIADSSNFNGIKLLDGSLQAGKAISAEDVVGGEATVMMNGAVTDTKPTYHKDAAKAGKTSFNVDFSNMATYTATDAAENYDLRLSGWQGKNVLSQDKAGNTAISVSLSKGDEVTGKTLADAVEKQLAANDGKVYISVGKDGKTAIEYEVKNNGDGTLTFTMTDDGYKTASDAYNTAAATAEVDGSNAGGTHKNDQDDWDVFRGNFDVGFFDKGATTQTGGLAAATMDDKGNAFCATTNVSEGSATANDILYEGTIDFQGMEIKDGAGLQIGDEYYVWATTTETLNKDFGSNVTVIDLTDLDSEKLSVRYNKDGTDSDPGPNSQGDTNVMTEIFNRLGQAVDEGNEMFQMTHDSLGNSVGISERRSYTGNADLTTPESVAKLLRTFDKIEVKNPGTALTLQIGDTSDTFNQLKVSVNDMHADALGIADIDISTQDGAAAAIDKIKAAINSVSSTRGDLGAIQNRLEHTQNNLSVMTENIQDAESTIRDTDIADEMTAYTKNNILLQSAQAMLAQANQVPQGVLQLLG